MDISALQSSTLAIGAPGMGELIVIFIIVLLLFGAKKLPELARGMGKSIKEFRKAASEMEEDFRGAMDATDPAKEKQKKREEGNKEVENQIAPPPQSPPPAQPVNKDDSNKA